MANRIAWLGTFSEIELDPRPLKAKMSLSNSGFRTMELVDKRDLTIPLSKVSSWIQMLFWGSIFHIGLNRNLAVRKFLSARMRNTINLMTPNSVDELIFLFDIDLLPFVRWKFPSNPIIQDFREIYTEQFGRDIKFRLFLRPIRKFILKHDAHKIKAGYTVSRGLIEFYRSEFGLNLSLIRSMPRYQNSASSSSSTPNIRIVYLGVAHPLRNIEKSIKAVIESRADIEIHLYLVGEKNYIDSLMRHNNSSPQIFFHPPVDFHKINETLSQYDLGWCYFIPETENLRNALPNKFFDYIQAGLGVICGPNADMMEEEKSLGFGFFASEYSDRALTELLIDLTPDTIEKAKLSAKRSKSEFTWEREEQKFLNLVEMVCGKP
jgi:glycosyltransferase involved in cell wall biosynthesis